MHSTAFYHSLIHSVQDYQRSNLLIAYIIACLLTVNMIIIWCSVRVWLFLRRSVSNLTTNSRVRHLSTQLNVVLVVQALTPFALELAPNLLSVVVAFLGYRIPSATALLSALLNWAPLVNALSVMLIVKPYRRVICRALRLKKSPSSTENVAVLTGVKGQGIFGGSGRPNIVTDLV